MKDDYARHTHSNKSVLDATTATFTSADESKLGGIATAAKANDTDANLKNRSNHTGTQVISTVTNLQTSLGAKVSTSFLAAGATSGDYDDLSNKPSIPNALVGLDTSVTGTQLNALNTQVDGVADGAEVNVNADWSAGSGDVQILNTPTLGTAADQNSTAFARAAQGVTTESAVQPADLSDLAVKDTVEVSDIDATGTPSTTTYFRGDGSWSTPAGGGGGASDWRDLGFDTSFTMMIDGQSVTMAPRSHVVVAYVYSSAGVLISDTDPNNPKRLIPWCDFNVMWSSMDQMALAVRRA